MSHICAGSVFDAAATDLDDIKVRLAGTQQALRELKQAFNLA